MTRIFVNFSQLCPLHVPTELLFYDIPLQYELPLGKDSPPPEGDVHSLRGGRSRLHLPQKRPDGRGDPSRVRIVSRHGTFEQGRVDEMSSEPAGVRVGSGEAPDVHPDDVFGSLAVADDVGGESGGDLAHSRFEFRELVFGERDDVGGEDGDGVGGGFVSVDGDGVVAVVDGRGEDRLKLGFFHCGVGEDIGQHGGHVGLDHTGSLGDPHDPGPALQRPTPQFGIPIGGHDRPCGREGVPVPLRNLRHGRGNHLPRQLFGGKPPPDHAGAARQNAPSSSRKIETGRHGVADRLGGGLAVVGGADVGDLVVDDQGLEGHPGGKAGSSDFDGGSGILIFGKNRPPALRRLVQRDHRPENLQTSHRGSLDGNERSRSRSASKSTRQRRPGLEVRLVFFLVAKGRKGRVGVGGGDEEGRGRGRGHYATGAAAAVTVEEGRTTDDRVLAMMMGDGDFESGSA
mmetsp:Transcript_29360/g.67435  ORF Transcript_29360/g.67435 Transcript_29360/m.67435 type:complete len:457 (-) Transcript_29360:167-1537(-)